MEVDNSMLRKGDCLDARVCLYCFRVNAVKAEKGREEDVAAACGLRHVTVLIFVPKKCNQSKKKFGICDKIAIQRLVQLRFINHNLKKNKKLKNERRKAQLLPLRTLLW